jgi:hypothetical protein
MGRQRSALAALVGLGGLLLTLVWAADRRPALDGLRERLRPRAVAGSTFGSGDTLRLALQRLGLIHAMPQVDRPSSEPGATTRPARRREGQARRERLYSLDPLRPEELAPALGIDPEWLRRPVTVAALLIDEDDLADLFAHPNARGSDWERPGFFALVDRGKLLVATDVGVRLHGGASRSFGEEGSFRIYFRERYGLDRAPEGLFPGRPGTPPSRLVLRHDGGVTRRGDWRQFTNPIALDVARAIGMPAPHTRPAATFVNGRFAGVKSLTEWIHLEYLATRHGHDDFVLVRTKAAADTGGERRITGDPRPYRELRAWLRENPRPTREEAAALVDLDSLVRWYLTITFCSTIDAFQGAMVREQGLQGRWSWIPWDLDGSFGYPSSPGDWNDDTVARILRRTEIRGVLMGRLLDNDRGFREQLLETAVDTLNHRLTPEFLEELVDRYAAYARDYRVERFDEEPLRAFMRHRPQRLLELLGERLGTGPPRRLRLEGPPGTAAMVGGHPVELPWEGWTYDALEVETAAARGARSAGLSDPAVPPMPPG